MTALSTWEGATMKWVQFWSDKWLAFAGQVSIGASGLAAWLLARATKDADEEGFLRLPERVVCRSLGISTEQLVEFVEDCSDAGVDIRRDDGDLVVAFGSVAQQRREKELKKGRNARHYKRRKGEDSDACKTPVRRQSDGDSDASKSDRSQKSEVRSQKSETENPKQNVARSAHHQRLAEFRDQIVADFNEARAAALPGRHQGVSWTRECDSADRGRLRALLDAEGPEIARDRVRDAIRHQFTDAHLRERYHGIVNLLRHIDQWADAWRTGASKAGANGHESRDAARARRNYEAAQAFLAAGGDR